MPWNMLAIDMSPPSPASLSPSLPEEALGRRSNYGREEKAVDNVRCKHPSRFPPQPNDRLELRETTRAIRTVARISGPTLQLFMRFG